MFWATFCPTLRKSPLRINGKFQKIDGPGVHFPQKLHQLPRPGFLVILRRFATGGAGAVFAEMYPILVNFLKFTVDSQWRFSQGWAKSSPEHRILYLLTTHLAVANRLSLPHALHAPIHWWSVHQSEPKLSMS